MNNKVLSLLNYIGIILFFTTMFCSKVLYGQHTNAMLLRQSIDSLYGLDQTLYNGKKYFPEHPQSKSSPFLFNDEIKNGTLYFKSKTYHNLKLRYNIYSQQFNLVYINHLDVEQQIILPLEHIDTVKIENYCFVKAPDSILNGGVVQLINGDGLQILCTWRKNYELVYELGDPIQKYTKAIRIPYLVYKEDLYKIKGNRSFIKCFPKIMRADLRQFVKQEKIKMQHANTDQLQEVINHISTLLE